MEEWFGPCDCNEEGDSEEAEATVEREDYQKEENAFGLPSPDRWQQHRIPCMHAANLGGTMASMACFTAADSVQNLQDLWTRKTDLGSIAKCFSVVHYELAIGERVFRGLE